MEKKARRLFQTLLCLYLAARAGQHPDRSTLPQGIGCPDQTAPHIPANVGGPTLTAVSCPARDPGAMEARTQEQPPRGAAAQRAQMTIASAFRTVCSTLFFSTDDNWRPFSMTALILEAGM